MSNGKKLSDIPHNPMSNVMSFLNMGDINALASTSNATRRDVGVATERSGQMARYEVGQRQYISGLSQALDLQSANQRIQHGQNLQQSANAIDANRTFMTINNQRVRIVEDHFK